MTTLEAVMTVVLRDAPPDAIRFARIVMANDPTPQEGIFFECQALQSLPGEEGEQAALTASAGSQPTDESRAEVPCRSVDRAVC